jgi:hypothetical protein
MPGNRYRLVTSDGDDAGEAEYSFNPQAGDEIYVNGNQRVRVTAVIPVELAGEFADDATHGLLEIEPLSPPPLYRPSEPPHDGIVIR